ncbi:glycosyltransferase [Radiobacillus kanasensis]|uniref:glycosyltransferase family 2 protein n=1 Tax=Radiobacillus kanasensis TaxID=2844358 RepID=UPI001E463AA4|nr:glycosyltransferase family 2 protein [Radiobacillus kanasensis]UFT98892.1 glycosyltransferase [Radiobacillus kanasensis]
MSTPTVTIITPTYNSSKFILETIRSVKSQTYNDWEMIIIDDCSIDNTVQIVEEQTKQDNRIKLMRLEKNSGAAVARNSGIKKAKGKYLAFLDSDDMWQPDKLSNQITFMKDNNYLFSYSTYSIINENGNFLNKTIRATNFVDYRTLLKKPGTIGCLTVILDREQIGDVLMPNIKTRQDFALWLKILKTGINAYGLDEDLALYRKVPGSISSNKIKAAKKNWYVYRNIEKLNLIKSLWYFCNYAIRAVIKTYF